MNDNRFYCRLRRCGLLNPAPYTVPTREPRRALLKVIWPVLGTLAFVALVVLGGLLDDADRLAQQAATQRRQNELRNQWEQGRQEGHREAVQMQLAKLRDTYAGGVAEGLERCPGVAK